MPGTTVTRAPDAAGVKCPADDPEWAKDHNCNDCQHQNRCYAAILGALDL